MTPPLLSAYLAKISVETSELETLNQLRNTHIPASEIPFCTRNDITITMLQNKPPQTPSIRTPINAIMLSWRVVAMPRPAAVARAAARYHACIPGVAALLRRRAAASPSLCVAALLSPQAVQSVPCC